MRCARLPGFSPEVDRPGPQDRVRAAKRDFTPVVKVASAKLVETVAEEELELAQQGCSARILCKGRGTESCGAELGLVA
jgi:hypothetical protein